MRIIVTIFSLLLFVGLLKDSHLREAAPQIIHPRIIREITASYSQYDKGKSAYAFDSSGGFVDPLNGLTNFPNRRGLHKVFPQKWYGGYFPGPAQGFPGSQGMCVVLDLTGAADMRDTMHRVSLLAIYGASATFDPGDSLHVYNLDVMLRAPIDRQWLYLARPDSMLTELGTLVTAGGNGAPMKWQHFNTHVSCRYLLLRITVKNRGNYSTIPDYSKLVIYGNYDYHLPDVATIPDRYTLPKTTPPTYGQFAGTNIGQGYDTLQTQWDGGIRIYGGVNYWDKQKTPGLETMTDPNFADIGNLQFASYKRHGQRAWWCISGGSNYTAGQTPGWARLNMDHAGLDPRDPHAYTRSGKFYFNFAAYYGSVAVDTAKTCFHNGTRNGKNIMHWVENGNEEDDNGGSSLSYWARTVNDYDGWEGRVGIAGQAGVKSADPCFRLVMAATTARDTNFVSCLVWYSALWRTDGRLPVDDITYHQYNRNTNVLGYDPGYDQEVGSHGISPALGNIYYDDRTYVATCLKYLRGDTSYHFYKTEYGYGNWGTPAATPQQASWPWDFSCVQPAGGYDSLQLKAIWMAQSETIMPFTGLSGYNEFFFHNSTFGPNSFQLYSSCGRTTGRDARTFRATAFFPFWYVRQWLYNNLKNYYPDSYLIYGGATGVHVQRWRNVFNAREVKYIVFNGGEDLKTLSRVRINTGAQTGRIAWKQASFTDSTGATGYLIASGGYVTIPAVTPMPMILSGMDQKAP
jgi:hypothetical protein